MRFSYGGWGRDFEVVGGFGANFGVWQGIFLRSRPGVMRGKFRRYPGRR